MPSHGYYINEKKDIKIVLILNSYLITSNMKKKKINGF